MEATLASGFNLRELASNLAVSERTLNRRFKQTIGLAPLEYLRNLQIEIANRLLDRDRSRSKKSAAASDIRLMTASTNRSCGAWALPSATAPVAVAAISVSESTRASRRNGCPGSHGP
ncbi:helix-turn-helix domain-containing protein [Bradyrhizobium sp. CCBAU 51765]|uniref:helix-turn-helix domain-containing protein n=1 Tax=Bradyrhizobium sp. CCBAU 51765 TaxID=1325102 RepID=UPI001887ECB0